MSDSDTPLVNRVSFTFEGRAPIKKQVTTDGLRHWLQRSNVPTTKARTNGREGRLLFADNHRLDHVRTAIAGAYGCSPGYLTVTPY